jgi:uncharacterized protein
MKLEVVLHSVTALIVRACDPERVILFGSYAKGQQNTDSDLDILVIGNFQESLFLRGLELQGLLHRYPIRIDLHMVTPQEIAAETAKPFGFVSSAIASGITLYARQYDRCS